ncbi:odorant receptor 13a-like [Venturia canescens]|uniref:odorant receptor 13a-like n=1 Tax=Venturia canescens TaxID=32260 RepID=UPI001C9C061D|nr:odorant receptor 13a-like [Venturia canescens]
MAHLRNEEEWKLYVNYNWMAKRYFKVIIPITTSAAFLYWFKPMQLRLIAALRNETVPYTLAYRVHYFFEVKDDRTFYLIWFYDFPTMWIPPWYASTIGLLVTLVYHISGQLSVLSFRVRNLSSKDFKDVQNTRIIFRDLAQTHHDILEYAYHYSHFFDEIYLYERDKYEGAKDLFRWIEHFYDLLGTWPLRSMNVRFTLWTIYIVYYLISAQIDLYYVFGDFQLTVQNLTETGLMVMMFVKLIVAKGSTKNLGTVIELTTKSIDPKHFRNVEEWELYVNYNRMAKRFFKIMMPMTILASFMFWFKPMQLRLIAAFRNETKPYRLAYRVHYFIEVNNDRTFYLIWFFNSPSMCIPLWYAATIGLLVALVYHISGQLSVLSFRVRMLTLKDFENEQTTRMVFQDLAQTHHDIIELAMSVNGVFGITLLEELFFSTVLIGLSIYATLLTFDVTNADGLFQWLTFGVSMLLLIYNCCSAGEYLVTESTKLCTAYYECLWYDMPPSCKKQLIICMLGASRPIQLSAAGFYDYSLFLFISIVKTAGGYISLLRTMTFKEG